MAKTADQGLSPTFFEDLAGWSSGLAFEDIPVPVIEHAKWAILDFAGVTVAGARHPLVDKVMAYLALSSADGAPRSPLIGRVGRASIEGAAFCAGVAGHVLDFDDTSDVLGGHPTVALLSPLLALGESRQSSGRQILTAYVAGYEALAHIASQVNFAHYERGWHPTATLGVFGSAVASARLLSLSAEQTSAALTIAASFSSGLKVSFGTHMKSVQVGEAARSGLRAALLASVGIEGNHAAFEGPEGFGAAYNGNARFNTDPIDRSPLRRWDLDDPGLVIKQYPCCGSTHSAIDAALEARVEVFSVDDIKEIRVRLHPRRLRHTDNPEPASGLEAKFSLQYVVAVALLRGRVTLDEFADEAVSDSAVRKLMLLVTAEEFEPEEYGPEHFAAEVNVVLRNGTQLLKRVEKARGRGTRLALTAEQRYGKFVSCSESQLGAEAASRVCAIVDELDLESDISNLLQCLVPA